MPFLYLENVRSCSALVPSPLHSFPFADQPVLQRSELALVVSAPSAQDIVACCHLLNDSIPWGTLAALDAQTRPMSHFTNLTADPLEMILNLEVFPLHDTATYVNDPMNEYDGPVCCHTLISCRCVC